MFPPRRSSPPSSRPPSTPAMIKVRGNSCSDLGRASGDSHRRHGPGRATGDSYSCGTPPVCPNTPSTYPAASARPAVAGTLAVPPKMDKYSITPGSCPCPHTR